MNYWDISNTEPKEEEVEWYEREPDEEVTEAGVKDLEEVDDKKEAWVSRPRGRINKDTGLTDLEEEFAENILAGMTYTDAARNMSDTQYPAQYGHMMKQKKHIMAYIQSKGREMFDIQVSMARDRKTPAAVRASVVKDILDRAWIKPEEEKQEFEATVWDITIKIVK